MYDLPLCGSRKVQAETSETHRPKLASSRESTARQMRDKQLLGLKIAAGREKFRGAKRDIRRRELGDKLENKWETRAQFLQYVTRWTK